MSEDHHSFLYPNRQNRRSLLFLLGSVAMITLPHAWHIPVALFGFFLGSLLWRVGGVWRRHWLPNRWLLFLVTLAGIALLVQQQHGVLGRDAGTGLFVVSLGLKLLELRGKRDIYLVVYLAFIVAASQFLYEQSILMAAYIVLVSTALLATLITQNSGQVKTLPAVKLAASILMQALPLAVLIFLVFPRLEAPRWMWLKDDSKAMTGLSNTLEPGAISELSLSDELVFRVRFDAEIPPPKLRYWRGPVFSKTDGVRWTAADNKQRDVSKPIFTGGGFAYTLLMEPQKENWVFALDIAETFDASLQRNAFYQLVTAEKVTERAEYKMVSRPFYNTGNISDAAYRENLQLPRSVSPRQRALVAALHGFDADPAQFIQNLLLHFRQEKFYYTLTPPLMPDDPIDTFLFETRSGFCSHYATAFVYLLRVAHIPARVVGGYQGGEVNPIGGFLEVRQADAHAWAEAWLAGKGWVRFDPTAAIAPERIERGVNVDLQIASGAINFSGLAADANSLNWLKRGRQLWQSIDYSWQRWVINYNSANRMQFLQSLGIDSLMSLVKWLVAGILFVTLPLAWWLLRRQAGQTDLAVKYYQRFCNKLIRKNIRINTGEGARDFAERAKNQLPDLAGQIEQITVLFIRLRYQNDADAADLRQLKSLVGGFRV